MKIYKVNVGDRECALGYIKSFFLLLIAFGFFEITYAAKPIGLKINKVEFNEEDKSIKINVCNWEKKDEDLGNYQLLVHHGDSRVQKVFAKGYVVNYACGVATVKAEELGIKTSGTFDIRIRFESVRGKLKDEKNSSFFIEYEKRFVVPEEPQADIFIENLEFDQNKRIITAEICNRGENYRISHKYYMSTSFSYNNNQAKAILKEKDLWADQCWDQEMDIGQLKIKKPGTYLVEVMVDSGNAVEERTYSKEDTAKEDNNRKTIEITIEESKKVVIKQRKKTPVKKSMSSMSLRERIAFMRGNKNQQSTTTSRKKVSTTTKKKSSRRRSLNYKSSSSRSTLKAKYPYLFR